MNKKPLYKPLPVANTIINMYKGDANEVQHMKLQKLVYLSYCWWLAKNDEPFIDEKPQVWRYGPVFSSLYSALRSFGGTPIQEPQKPIFDTPPPFVDKGSKDVLSLIDWVVGKYGKNSSSQLSSLTHETGSPWHIMAERYGFEVPLHLEIESDVIKKHYRETLKGIMP